VGGLPYPGDGGQVAVQAADKDTRHDPVSRMSRITGLRITNYRSVKGPIQIAVPFNRPLVLVGENNAGKSNIVRALELMLGERWPGNHDPDDHEYFGRNPDGDPIELRVEVDGVSNINARGENQVAELVWRYPPDEDVGKTLYMVFTTGERNGYVSNETREQCLCLTIGADRRLSYQLSYTSKWTLLSKLMRQFHKTLSEDPDAVEQLRARFEEVKEIFRSVAPCASFSAELDQQVEALAGNLSYGLAIDFSAYDPSNFFHALRVLPREGTDMRTFDELGTGQEQILAIAFAHAYARAFHGEGRTLILVIEEPEAHLHPLAQRWVAQHLCQLAHSESVQVIVTTHSPAFVRMLDLEGLVLVRRSEGAEVETIVKQLAPAELAEHCRRLGAAMATEDTILPFYEAAATEVILAGLFARKVVLVEGPTEAEALPVYFARVGLDVIKEGVAVIPVMGVGNLAKWVRLFSAYEIPVFVIFDNDSEEDADGYRRDDLFTALELEEDVAQRLLNATGFDIEPSIAVVGTNFEQTLRRLFGDEYEAKEREAVTNYRLGRDASKPLVGRFIAEGIDPEQNSPAWDQMQRLAQAVLTSGVTPSREEAAAPEDDAIPF
jgi:putative ATP-dependent endonuclease of the OLD family